jgi:hypothetical protein
MTTTDLSLGRPEQIPDFAQPWRVHYARWDGGPIHVAKGILSGWMYTPEPHAVYALDNFYDLSTVKLLSRAGINWAWVTWSIGFPPEDEKVQWELLRPYIEACHAAGIRLTAYLSMTNMCRELWAERRPESEGWIQRDFHGNRIPYGAAIYGEVPTRYLACLSQPDWQKHLLVVADAALDAGVDGLEYDNAGSGCQCPRCQQAFRAFAAERFGRDYDPVPDFGPVLGGVVGQVQRVAGVGKSEGPIPDLQSTQIWHRFVNHLIGGTYARVAAHARARKPDVLFYGNNNTDMHTFTYPSNNAISTEDAAEPGWVDGRLVNNGGLLRLLQAAANRWKPVRLEYAVGHVAGTSEATRRHARSVWTSRFWPMPPRKQQLSIAEAASHGASVEITPEGYLSVDLFFQKPEALRIWDAIGRYHAFLDEHVDLYERPESTAQVAFLTVDNVDYPRDQQRRILLDALAGAGLDFDVILDRHLPGTDLGRYSLVVLPDARYLSDAVLGCLRAYAEAGGHLLVTGQSAGWDERFMPRAAAPFAGWPNVDLRSDLEEGRIAENLAEKECFLGAVLEYATRQPFPLSLPRGVVGRFTWQRERRRYVLHLLNYGDAPAGPIRIRDVTGEGVTLESPDSLPPQWYAVPEGLVVEQVDIYSVLTFPGGRD